LLVFIKSSEAGELRTSWI